MLEFKMLLSLSTCNINIRCLFCTNHFLLKILKIKKKMFLIQFQFQLRLDYFCLKSCNLYFLNYATLENLFCVMSKLEWFPIRFRFLKTKFFSLIKHYQETYTLSWSDTENAFNSSQSFKKKKPFVHFLKLYFMRLKLI